MALTFPIVFGTISGYTTANYVRMVCNLGENDISDADLENLIAFASSQFNRDVSRRITEEEVESLDTYRQNTVDGTNTTFHTQTSWDYYIGDRDDDGDVDVSDVDAWVYYNSTKYAGTVAAIDDVGKVYISPAPPCGSTVKLSYVASPVDMETPHWSVTTAVTYLVTALAYGKIEARDMKRISLGRLSVQRTPIGYKHFMERYREMIRRICAKEYFRKQTGDETAANLSPYQLEPVITTSAGGNYFG